MTRDDRTAWNSTLKPGKSLRRSTPLPAPSTPMTRTRRMKSGKPLKATGRGRKCYAHLRDPEFKAWVREQPCLLAGIVGHVCSGRVEFSHVANEGNGGADFANGLPLCSHAAHRFGAKSWHVMGRDSWQAHWGVNAELAAMRLARDYTREQVLESGSALRDFGGADPTREEA